MGHGREGARGQAEAGAEGLGVVLQEEGHLHLLLARGPLAGVWPT